MQRKGRLDKRKT